MKKRHLLPAIRSLTLLSITLLVVIFVRHYQPTPKPIEPVVDNTENIENIEDTNPENQANEPQDEPLEFVKSDKSYFDDAIIIGDSRTVGIFEYGDMGNITY